MNKRATLFFALIVIISVVACVGNSFLPYLPTIEPTAIPTLGVMEMAMKEPRPAFIRVVSPPEYSVVSYDYYQYRLPNSVGPSMSPNPHGFYSAVCVGLSLEHLIEKGDQLDTISKVLERVELWVNGEKMEIMDRAYRGLLMVPQDDEWQGTFWVENDGYCWNAPVDTGTHQVSFQFQQTSGYVQEYTWYFEIVTE